MSGKKALRSSVMSMRFMQRAQEEVHRTELQKKQQQVLDESQWVVSNAAEILSFVAEDEQPAPIFQTVAGRRSFGNFNPKIEKTVASLQVTAQQIAKDQADLAVQEREKEITLDELEMAETYQSFKAKSSSFSGSSSSSAAVKEAAQQFLQKTSETIGDIRQDRQEQRIAERKRERKEFEEVIILEKGIPQHFKNNHNQRMDNNRAGKKAKRDNEDETIVISSTGMKEQKPKQSQKQQQQKQTQQQKGKPAPVVSLVDSDDE